MANSVDQGQKSHSVGPALVAQLDAHLTGDQEIAA